MKEYICMKINAEKLLSQGDLDIRGLAAEHPKMTADAYFKRLEIFSEKAMEYAGMLFAEPETVQEELLGIGYNGPPTAEVLEKLSSKIKGAYIRRRNAEAIERNQSDILLSEALEYFDYVEAHRKLRILAVDDVAVVLNTITSVLSPYYQVFALTKGEQVEAFLNHTTPELFLLDIEMPDMNGYELASLIRSFDKHKDTPIIYLTSNATKKNIMTAVSVGACDFITKPVRQDVLLEKISSQIVRKKLF